ncbi:hypothetical protein BDF19DRAFT_441298 [Syncephalis fuscata]|nr:hypothetical protein BDF19DRAFT_441298 [Syncephalis fuscata]
MLAFYRKSSTTVPLRLNITQKPSIFQGEHEDNVEEWLGHFESCAKYNKWPRNSWSRLAYLYLSETWQAWFSAHTELADGKWRVFRREFSRAVGPPNRHHLLISPWRLFVQKPEENAHSHAHRFYSSLLGQLAEANRTEPLDRYLVVIYRKTRAVVDDVGSELGKAVFCAFVSEDVSRLARCTSDELLDLSHDQNSNNSEDVTSGNHVSGNRVASIRQQDKYRPSSLVLSPRLLGYPIRVQSSPISPRFALRSNVEGIAMAKSPSSPANPVSPLAHPRTQQRRRLHQRYVERIQELIHEFDDLSRQFEQFRPRPASLSHARRPSTANLETVNSNSLYENEHSDQSYCDQQQQFCNQSHVLIPSRLISCFNCGLNGHRKHSCRLPKRTAPALLEAIARACR